MQAIFETIFDVIYLSTCVILGVIMIKRSNGNKEHTLFGIMSIRLTIKEIEVNSVYRWYIGFGLTE